MTAVRSCGNLRRTIVNTCKPSIFGMLRSEIRSEKASDSSRAIARATEVAVWISGRRGSRASISRYSSSKSLSSSRRRILWRLDMFLFIELADNTNLSGRELQATYNYIDETAGACQTSQKFVNV